MNDGIELIREARADVVARALRFGLVDHADGALEARVGERIARIGGAKNEALEASIVKEALVAARERRRDAPPFRGLVPFARRGYRARVRREAHEEHFLAVTLARQLTEVQLAPVAHLRGARVAQV